MKRGVDAPHHRSGRAAVIPTRVIARLLASMIPDGNGCQIPSGSTNGSGYKRRSWSVRGRHYHLFAHQIIARAVILNGGPIPVDHVVHHTCRNRTCCNPTHLELVSVEEHKEVHRASLSRF